MRFDVLTLFPGMFPGYLDQSLLKLAIRRGLVEVQVHNIRDWGLGRHNQVDDRPFGGGPGMVLMVEPVVNCVEAVQATGPVPGQVIMLSPQGEKLTQGLVEELSTQPRLLLLCGRYEGFDERVKELVKPREVSIGDYILNGGEVAAMVMIDALIRLVPGVLGDEESPRQDSFSGERRLLEFAQYTRPREYRGLAVPDVLLDGNHGAIARWREEQSLRKTREQRSDLLAADGWPSRTEAFAPSIRPAPTTEPATGSPAPKQDGTSE
ncbi:MAG TPA: tRNA (guanosine(37)-N1)-methyltransferase TrmD [Pirellulales bacterium]